jgi:hypothetical protein
MLSLFTRFIIIVVVVVTIVVVAGFYAIKGDPRLLTMPCHFDDCCNDNTHSDQSLVLVVIKRNQNM